MYHPFEMYCEDYTLYNLAVLTISLTLRQKQYKKAFIISQNGSHDPLSVVFQCWFQKWWVFDCFTYPSTGSWCF